ncbi:FtsW/RodA/SpoVE family cell cycle protein, partial [Patescibacteria group bacterium]|nr:FtsW/RodA/SpoVE family cell cycle protein [Patescibacteria group bacterium]
MRLFLEKIDWILFLSAIPLLTAGLITMRSFGGGDDYFFGRQLIWIALGIAIFLWLSFSDLAFLRSSGTLVTFYLIGIFALVLLLVIGGSVRGAASWFHFGIFSLEPVEPIKIILILMLAKYFSRRHIDIANIRHIIVSGFYVLIPMMLVFLQPDFGSALVLGVLWLGMVMASGISKKHFFALMALATVGFIVLWFFVLAPYQRLRIEAFIDPYIDPQGAGYHTIQTQIAVGAGGLWGRGIGFGSQSR